MKKCEKALILLEKIDFLENSNTKSESTEW